MKFRTDLSNTGGVELCMINAYTYTCIIECIDEIQQFDLNKDIDVSYFLHNPNGNVEL